MAMKERRNNKRFPPGKPTFVALRPDFSRLGKLLDICMGGLSFRYLSHDTKEIHSSIIEIDLFINGDDFYLPGINCRIIHDTGYNTDTVLPEGLKNRRCGVQFRDLTGTHRNMLMNYMAESSIRRAEIVKKLF